MIKITYYSTLYKKEETCLVWDCPIEFKDGAIFFKWMGSGKMIEFKYVRKIEELQ